MLWRYSVLPWMPWPCSLTWVNTGWQHVLEEAPVPHLTSARNSTSSWVSKKLTLGTYCGWLIIQIASQYFILIKSNQVFQVSLNPTSRPKCQKCPWYSRILSWRRRPSPQFGHLAIPTELLMMISAHLDPPSMLLLALTCQSFYYTAPTVELSDSEQEKDFCFASPWERCPTSLLLVPLYQAPSMVFILVSWVSLSFTGPPIWQRALLWNEIQF